MKSRWIRRYWLLFGLYALGMGLYLWVTSSNTVPLAYRGTPADPATFYTAEQLRQSEVYSAQRNWLFFMAYPWEWGIYLTLLFGGWAGRLQERLERSVVPGILRLPLYVAAVSGISFLAYLPLLLIGYTLSRSYGISTQSLPGWLRDKVVDFGVSILIVLAAASAAYWFIRRGGRWWLKLWLLSVPFTIFLMYIQPLFIDPLYNKFSRLSDPALERQIIQLADKAGVPADRVYEADMSQKTNALNAYVNGVGSSLRIVLWDTLLRLNRDEILLIVAHEMGHYVKHHLEWSAAGAVLSSFVLLGLGNVLLQKIIRRWGAGWGVRRPGDLAAFPVMLLFVSALTFVSLPFTNAVSRQAERAADRYAMDLIGHSGGAVSMNQKLAAATLDDVNPPLLVRWFRSTHPSAMERIVDAEAFEKGTR